MAAWAWSTKRSARSGSGIIVEGPQVDPQPGPAAAQGQDRLPGGPVGRPEAEATAAWDPAGAAAPAAAPAVPRPAAAPGGCPSAPRARPAPPDGQGPGAAGGRGPAAAGAGRAGRPGWKRPARPPAAGAPPLRPAAARRGSGPPRG